MAEPARTSPAHPDDGGERWTVDEFLRWVVRQDDPYELVDGKPVRMMGQTRNAHADIAINVTGEFIRQLRGSGCRPIAGGTSVETLPGQVRLPDVGVDCGPRDPDGLMAGDPRVVVEVLSPGTRSFDVFRKVMEY